MITHAKFMGKSLERSFGASIDIHPDNARVQSLTATAGSLNVRLPDARLLKKGAPILVLFNPGANTWTATMHASGTVATVATNQFLDLNLLDNSTENGTWKWRRRTALA